MIVGLNVTESDAYLPGVTPAAISLAATLTGDISVGAVPSITGIAAGCMPLPPEGAVDVVAGGTSDQWTVRFDPGIGCPTSLVNRALQDASGSNDKPPATSEAAESAVREVFRSRPEWFRLRPGTDDFHLVRDEARGWLRYMRFEQTYRGVSVAGAGYEARVLPNARVGSLDGHYYPDITVEVRPTISAAQALDRARTQFQPGTTGPQGLPQVQFETENGFRDEQVLALIPNAGKFTLAWGVIVATSARDHQRVYVDALDGTLLGRQFVGWLQGR